MHDCCLSVCAPVCIGTLVVFTHMRQREDWVPLRHSLLILSSNPPILVQFGFGIAGYNAQPVTGCWDLNFRPYAYRALLTIRPSLHGYLHSSLHLPIPNNAVLKSQVLVFLWLPCSFTQYNINDAVPSDPIAVFWILNVVDMAFRFLRDLVS